jgi:hypothetical protein
VRHPFHPLAVLSFFAACCSSANADILIDPTFDSSITSDPNATIESAIDQAISRFESSIETPITVKIDFQETSGGLGESNSGFNEISYSQYRSDLVNNMTSTNPVNGDPDVILNLANLRAVGETGLGNNGGGFDSTIGGAWLP